MMGDEAMGESGEGAIIVRLAVAAFVLLFATACLLWLGYGQNIFADLVTFVRSCF
jgi:hypothetical protein